jgi:WhiB family transcriptional regulator, redox-sensing transcriptional regulator
MADFSRLPGPNADLWDWQLRGLCRGKDSSLFFHPEGERGAARSSREVAAKEICLNCPVQIRCADHALKVREPYGVWGGMTEEEREEHHARQKALARAQAAREKAARLRQEQMKEKLLREKELENRRKESSPPPNLTRPAAEKSTEKPAAKPTAKPAARKTAKTLVKA